MRIAKDYPLLEGLREISAKYRTDDVGRHILLATIDEVEKRDICWNRDLETILSASCDCGATVEDFVRMFQLIPQRLAMTLAEKGLFEKGVAAHNRYLWAKRTSQKGREKIIYPLDN